MKERSTTTSAFSCESLSTHLEIGHVASMSASTTPLASASSLARTAQMADHSALATAPQLSSTISTVPCPSSRCFLLQFFHPGRPLSPISSSFSSISCNGHSTTYMACSRIMQLVRQREEEMLDRIRLSLPGTRLSQKTAKKSLVEEMPRSTAESSCPQALPAPLIASRSSSPTSVEKSELSLESEFWISFSTTQKYVLDYVESMNDVLFDDGYIDPSIISCRAPSQSKIEIIAPIPSDLNQDMYCEALDSVDYDIFTSSPAKDPPDNSPSQKSPILAEGEDLPVVSGTPPKSLKDAECPNSVIIVGKRSKSKFASVIDSPFTQKVTFSNANLELASSSPIMRRRKVHMAPSANLARHHIGYFLDIEAHSSPLSKKRRSKRTNDAEEEEITDSITSSLREFVVDSNDSSFMEEVLQSSPMSSAAQGSSCNRMDMMAFYRQSVLSQYDTKFVTTRNQFGAGQGRFKLKYLPNYSSEGSDEQASHSSDEDGLFEDGSVGSSESFVVRSSDSIESSYSSLLNDGIPLNPLDDQIPSLAVTNIVNDEVQKPECYDMLLADITDEDLDF